jgi:hypothetical protein
MAIFPMSGVLPEFPPATYQKVRLNENPCAALRIKKIAHFLIGNYLLKFFALILYPYPLGSYSEFNPPPNFVG